MLKYFFYLILISIFSSSLLAQEDPSVYYQKGVEAKTIGERESNFEKALKLYMNQQISLKEKGSENGYLLFNIGNCYYNLDQLGESILYYKQALKLLPHDEKIKQNYNIAIQKRTSAVDVENNGVLSETLLFFHYSITEKNKILIMFIISVFILSFFIFNLKIKRNFINKMSVLLTLAYFLLLFSLFVNYFYPQREGVLIKDSLVYQDAGENYSSLVTKPLGIGSSIQVIQNKDGWYKVRLNDGRFGFVKETSLQLIL